MGQSEKSGVGTETTAHYTVSGIFVCEVCGTHICVVVVPGCRNVCHEPEYYILYPALPDKNKNIIDINTYFIKEESQL